MWRALLCKELAPRRVGPWAPAFAGETGEGCEGRRWGLSQEAAAARLGITRPRLNDLLRGNLGKVSPGALVNLATAAGLRLEIRAEVAA